MSVCPKCGEGFDAVSGYCPFDGTPLSVEPSGEFRPISAMSSSSPEDILREQKKQFDYNRLVGLTLDNRYRIEKKLGEGGMGVVYRARHVVIDKRVAVKVLKREVAARKIVVTRFVQEARAASRIGHPNIVDVTDFGITPHGLTYQVMEYIEGTTLNRIIRKAPEPMTLDRAVPIVGQIARALSVAHEKGIIHRDLKPENVFLIERDGYRDFVKIVDFGIAKVLPVDGTPVRRLTKNGSVFGTPEYMAPEQAAGKDDIDQRVDIYSLGTILYELVVGRVPHHGKNAVRTIAMQMLDRIVPPNERRPGLGLPMEVEAVIMRALAKRRDARFHTMQEFAQALESTTGIATSPGGPAGAARGGRSGVIPIQLPGMTGAPSATAAPTRVRPSSAPPPAGPSDTGRTLATRDSQQSRVSRLDPAFLSSGSDSLRYDLIDQPRTPSPRRSDTPWWPKAAATLALFIGVGAGVATLVRALGATPVAETPAPQTTTAAAQPEPTQQQPSPPPVAPPAEQVEEAAPAEERPAAPVVRTASNRKLPPPRYEQVSVITRPEGGNLYVGGSYSGPDGTHLRRRWGSRLEVACKMPGFRDGNVTVRFDGKTAVYLCRLRPRQRAAARRKPAVVDGCVEGLKNPFKECN